MFRVLLFGDSYTAGMGVSDAARYGDVLERLLPGVEVYNFGLPGSGTDQQYLIHREYAARYEHDLVVIGAMVENIRRVASRYRPYATLEGESLILAKPYFTLEVGRRAPAPPRAGAQGSRWPPSPRSSATSTATGGWSGCVRR